jgi:hypothetical protein
MSEHVTAGKKNCVTLMIPQRPEIIRSEFGKKLKRVHGSIQHWTVNYDIRNRQITNIFGIRCKCEGLFQATRIVRA